MEKITPFLWFDGNAEEAAKFYVSVFPNSKITGIARNGKDMPGPQGAVLTVSFELNGQNYVALNGGPGFPFTQAVSFFITCANQEEIDYYWEKLTAGGKEIQCGWLVDKFGLSWQVVPDRIMQWLNGGDQGASDRVMQAVMKMVKLDFARLQQAYDGRG
jgi:predicted 3-demethylubiquinone-9 3-methyltransferase (glyoxalase superfamily)